MEYNDQIKLELFKWQQELLKKPPKMNALAKKAQDKFNHILPEKYHKIMTSAIKEMTKTVLTGAAYTSHETLINLSLKERDAMALRCIQTYKQVGVVEGAGTGGGGILVGLTDFPLLLGIKMKMLYELAAIYGFDTSSYKERIYILMLFELAFSSQEHTADVYKRIQQWELYKKTIPTDIETFDWRTFQQEYRDYLDVAKLMQMVPVIGAPIGAYVNHKLLQRLGYTAMQGYRMRWARYM